MAVRRLAALTPSTANTATLLATADGTYVASVIATNVSDVDAVVTIYVKPFNAGDTATAWSFLGLDIALSAGQSFETFRFAIESGDEIIVKASTIAVNFTCTAIYEAEGRSNITVSAIEPTFPVVGDIWLSSLTDVFSIWNGSDWAYVAAATPVGPQGVTGPTGPTGEQGQPAVDFSLLGTVATVGDLPEFGTLLTSNALTGETTYASAYYVVSEESVYVWRTFGWANAGPILGPTGPQAVSFIVIGEVFAVTDLPSEIPAITEEGLYPAYYVSSIGEVYVSNGTEWNSVGPIIGPTGPTGPAGVTGEKGAPSLAFNLLGSVETFADLPATGNTTGDAYHVRSYLIPDPEAPISEGDILTGLFAWDGAQWVSVGYILGPTGATGPTGDPGEDGLSAYAIAVANGFVGDVVAWEVSLLGAEGPQGPTGAPIQLKGSVANTVDLPPSGNTEYDVWNVTGINAAFVWDGAAWVQLGALIGATGPAGADGAAGSGAVDVAATVAASTFVGLYESASGTSVGGKTSTGITYNASSGTLTVTAIETESINAPASLTGTYALTSPTTITLDPVDEVILTAPAVLPVKTTAELAALTSSVGSIAYNSDDVGIAVYDGSSWATVLTTTGPQGEPGADGADGVTVTQNYQVSNNGASNYIIDGASNPALTLVRGRKYFFTVNASGHPFWIQTTGSGYVSGDAYSTGVTNNGTQVGGVEFTVDATAPNTLYYQCQFHAGMVGTINIIG